MRVTDLISSYSGYLPPEPATSYAEIIHVSPPDYHPTVESFDLAARLWPIWPPHPGSSPWIWCAFTAGSTSKDEPTVSVTGAVRKPGMYPAPRTDSPPRRHPVSWRSKSGCLDGLRANYPNNAEWFANDSECPVEGSTGRRPE